MLAIIIKYIWRSMELFNGAKIVDDRGSVSFVNDFDFAGVKRFYIVENHDKGFVRAWHGHQHEGKYVYVTRGSAIVGAVKLSSGQLQRYVLSAANPQVLWIPAGHANGFKTLTDDTQIMFFSTSTLTQSQADDIRYP